MALSTFVRKLASDPKTQEMARKVAATAQRKATDPATRAKVESALERARRAVTKR